MDKLKYIDIHCHLDFPDYGDDGIGVFARMVEQEVGAITIGTDLESSRRAVKIAEENENVWACIGVHPEGATSPRSASQSDPLLNAGEGKNSSLPLHIGEGQSALGGWDEVEFEKLIASPKVVAIGECGLDYFGRRSLGGGGLSEDEKNLQKKLFKQQIEFALKHNKPLMLHCRDSYDDVLDILESYKNLKGNAHFFAGNVEQSKRFLNLGFTMSFTGVITFTKDYDEVIKSLPIERIMSETDAPFVAPKPHRGKRNEPVFVIEVVKKLSEIRGENEEVLREQILQNAQNLFGLRI